jgi:hypothetical protein
MSTAGCDGAAFVALLLSPVVSKTELSKAGKDFRNPRDI